jgi:hypothetical protein
MERSFAVGDDAQERAVEEFLRPYVEEVSDAEARIEPYRTKFWWKVTRLTRDY